MAIIMPGGTIYPKKIWANYPDWAKRTPPNWMRRVTPWRALYWLNKRLPVCWADVVTWKLGYRPETWWPDWGCTGSNPPWDWCGKYRTPADQENLAEPDLGVTTPPVEALADSLEVANG